MYLQIFILVVISSIFLVIYFSSQSPLYLCYFLFSCHISLENQFTRILPLFYFHYGTLSCIQECFWNVNTNVSFPVVYTWIHMFFIIWNKSLNILHNAWWICLWFFSNWFLLITLKSTRSSIPGDCHISSNTVLSSHSCQYYFMCFYGTHWIIFAFPHTFHLSFPLSVNKNNEFLNT